MIYLSVVLTMAIYIGLKPDQKRTGLLLDYSLEDRVSNVKNKTQAIKLAKGFGDITDMKVGSVGYLFMPFLYEGGDDCGPIYQPGNLCILFKTFEWRNF
jgi:hypothetical protein